MSRSETITEGNRLDRLGAAASMACAVHCAAMPLLAGLLPLVGMSFLASDLAEWLLVGLSLGVGSLSLAPSYARKHRQWRPLLLFTFGASLIIVVRLSAEEGSRLEAPAMALGAADCLRASDQSPVMSKLRSLSFGRRITPSAQRPLGAIHGAKQAIH